MRPPHRGAFVRKLEPGGVAFPTGRVERAVAGLPDLGGEHRLLRRRRGADRVSAATLFGDDVGRRVSHESASLAEPL
jgi:hypothetical protein